MKTTFVRRSLILLTFLLFLQAPSEGADTIRVVTSTPDLKDMVETICGDDVSAQSLMKGTENPHAVPLKPSFLVMLSRCDVLVVNGFEYEHAFLPGALMSVNNQDIQRGASHYIDAGRFVKPCEVPDKIDLALGDLHPLGSSHVHIDPGNGILMCKAIYEQMKTLYGDPAKKWKPRYEAYVRKLYAKMKELQKLAKPTQGMKIVFYHPGWCYIANRMKWHLVGYVEARAGIPPTPKDVQRLIRIMRNQNCKLIAVEVCYSTKVPDYVAAQVGAKVVKIPHHVNAMPKCRTYLEFLDTLVRTIVKAGMEAEGREAGKPEEPAKSAGSKEAGSAPEKGE